MLATDNVYRAIWTSWNDDVFLPELAGKFWKLTLQFIGRYKVWLETNMPEFRAMAKPVASNAAVLSGASATGSIVGLNRVSLLSCVLRLTRLKYHAASARRSLKQSTVYTNTRRDDVCVEHR